MTVLPNSSTKFERITPVPGLMRMRRSSRRWSACHGGGVITSRWRRAVIGREYSYRKRWCSRDALQSTRGQSTPSGSMWSSRIEVTSLSVLMWLRDHHHVEKWCGSEGREHRDVERVATPPDHDLTGPALAVVARVDGVPAATDEHLAPGAEVHGLVDGGNVDIGNV